jgi:hypothetical protein
VVVGGGRGPYRAVSSDDTVIAAGVTGSSIQLQAVRAGSVNISVFDSKGLVVNFGASVAGPSSLVVAPESISGTVGDRLAISLFGGYPGYSISPVNSTLTTLVSQTNDRFVLDLLSPGTSPVIVRDSRGDFKQISLTVNAAAIKPLGLNVPSPVQLAVGSDRSVMISGGVLPYSVGSSDESIVGASLAGRVLTLLTLNQTRSACQCIC